MSWRDKLRKASFRGIPFEWVSDDTEISLRVIEHKFAETDGADPERLALEGERYRLNAYIIGEDYQERRDALIEAIKKPGAGILIHPEYGRKKVYVPSEGIRVRHQIKEKRMAVITVTFVEWKEDKSRPKVEVDTIAVFNQSADQADKANIAAFENDFNASDLPDFATTQISDVIGKGINTIDQNMTPLLGFSVQDAAVFARDIYKLSTNVSSMLNDPTQIASTIGTLMTNSTKNADPVEVVYSVQPVAAFENLLPNLPRTTATRKQQTKCQNAFAGFLKRAALITESRATCQIDFASYDDALSARNDLAERLEAELFQVEDDNLFRSIEQLRADLVRNISQKSVKLPRLVSVPLQATQPAILVAQRLFGDDPSQVLAKTEEIIKRNKLRHGGFCPGGETLEVLGNV